MHMMYRYQCEDCKRNVYLEELKPSREVRCVRIWIVSVQT